MRLLWRTPNSKPDWNDVCIRRSPEDPMSREVVQRKSPKYFLDIPSAALQAGYSSRHFRRIIEEDRIPVMQIGRKYFIIASDLKEWIETRGEARLDQTIQQLDRLLKQNVQISSQPSQDFEEQD